MLILDEIWSTSVCWWYQDHAYTRWNLIYICLLMIPRSCLYSMKSDLHLFADDTKIMLILDEIWSTSVCWWYQDHAYTRWNLIYICLLMIPRSCLYSMKSDLHLFADDTKIMLILDEIWSTSVCWWYQDHAYTRYNSVAKLQRRQIPRSYGKI